MTNPLIWADVPDVDVIRVGKNYYMSSTSMHTMPGVPIMRSIDLVNWDIVSYVYDTFADNDAHNLLNGQNIYGKGSWATSLRYHKNNFYVCFGSLDTKKTYIYKTADITGKWTRITLLDEYYHDPSLFFDDDGRVYIIYGNGEINIIELTEDATNIKPGGLNQNLFTTSDGHIVNGEGSHAYKIDGSYYIFIIQWPKETRRTEWCFRSSSLTGLYEGKIVLDDDLGYHNKGVAQGGIVDASDGKWYAMLFQDHDAVGRIPVIIPVTWEDGWPVMGIDGKVPVSMTMPVSRSTGKTALLTSDEFNANSISLNWQWNHNPDNRYWSLTQRPGYLRLITRNTVSNIFQSCNTLTQRTQGPVCSGEVALQTENMKGGDYAGIAAFQNAYGFIGVKKDMNGQRHIVMATNSGNGEPKEEATIELNQDRIYLKIFCDFINSVDKASFYYSLDGLSWTEFGAQLDMKYTLDHFMGYRFALFCYATKESGGIADFDFFHASVKAE